MSDQKTFSDKLMELTKILQQANESDRQNFGMLFMSANKLAESGFSQEQLQLIAITAYQCHKNPELKQMFNLLMGVAQTPPDDDYQ
tara:strand:+ start:1896 stop:2153 length:258 start_codon:yes stop_codon:yes gene_type:complete